MKKIYISVLAVAAMLLSSCEREKDFRDITVGENELAFVMQGVSTRSAVEGSPYAVKGISIPMGDGMYLEETVEELNPSPMTKGAPAYTVTLPNLYPTMGVYAAGNFGDAVFGSMDETQYDENGWRYNHDYGTNPWPNETDKVSFYLRMPATGDGFEYNATSFKLTSPENGKEQADLLFGQVSVNKKEHDAKLPAGVPVTMKHALTGIKFRNGHLNNNQTKTIIRYVELVGLNTYGEGTVGTDGVVTWNNVKTPNTEDNPFYLVFDNPEYKVEEGVDPKTNPDGTVTTWDTGLDGTSWTAAAADHNLNHANGELTFWFIPQEVPDGLELNIIFRVKTPDTPEGVDVRHTIALGELLNTKNGGPLTWAAGQLRTYTLKPYDVDVEIKDGMTAVTKSDLHIANTGNVDEYVRMLIMGNWYGWKPGTTEAQMKSTEPSILVGYKYKDAAAATADGGNVNDMVDPWYREGQDTDGDGKFDTDIYGSFDGTFPRASLTNTSLGNRDGKRNDWADASGGYYFTMPIGPGAGVGEDAVSATKALFESYTVTNVPDIYLPVGNTREKAVGVHLVMEIVVQAIAVPTNADGTQSSWWLQAWYDATGIAKLNPNETRNKKYKDYYTDGEYNSQTSGSGE